jgi:hypothetical protein
MDEIVDERDVGLAGNSTARSVSNRGSPGPAPIR